MKPWKFLIVLGYGLWIFSAPCPWKSWGQEPAAPVEAGIGSVEERRLRFSLRQERDRLYAEYQKKEEFLSLREIELKTLAAEVDKKLDDLRKLRGEFQKLLAQKSEEEAKRVRELSKMYEKMDPAQAAALLADLDEELAIDILSGMKAKSAGKLLNSMKRNKAARLSAAYSTLGQD